ncbi:hypothetical protein C8F01DRAFT_1112087 [Mycena amicta]|nr:hypothetical protein C8F01DRAFT_1112087 [Mycena amicta]
MGWFGFRHGDGRHKRMDASSSRPRAPRIPVVALPAASPTPAFYGHPSFAQQWTSPAQAFYGYRGQPHPSTSTSAANEQAYRPRTPVYQHHHPDLRMPIPTRGSLDTAASRFAASVASPTPGPTAAAAAHRHGHGRRVSATPTTAPPPPPPGPASRYGHARSSSDNMPPMQPQPPPRQPQPQPQPRPSPPPAGTPTAIPMSLPQREAHDRDYHYTASSTSDGTRSRRNSQGSSRGIGTPAPPAPRPVPAPLELCKEVPVKRFDPLVYTEGPKSILKTSRNRGQRVQSGDTGSSRRGSNASGSNASTLSTPAERMPAEAVRRSKPGLLPESISLNWPLTQSIGRPGHQGYHRPCIRYDIGRSPRAPKSVMDLRPTPIRGFHFLSPADLRLPASTHCVLTAMRIVGPYVPVIHLRRDAGLRVIDVLEGIYDAYSPAMNSPAEVPTEIRRDWGALIEALDARSRCTPQGNGEATAVRSKGMCKVDLLLGNRMFNGLERHGADWKLQLEWFTATCECLSFV